MIDFNDLDVRRIIIHTINSKERGQDCATVEYSKQILTIDENVLDVLKVRLVDAAGRNSKAFELEIKETDPSSFFGLSKGLNQLDDLEFIKITSDIADLLAASQRRTSISGGYLIIMNCVDSSTNGPVHIVIKAEPHEALQFSSVDGHNQLNVLQKVFLSPSQKLYKIGIIYQKTNETYENENDRYGCFLYDDQFRTDTHPAEYFYKEFLGFSVSDNAKIQSQRFYDKTENFIYANVSDFKVKAQLLTALKTEFLANLNATVNLVNFANTYFPKENGLLDSYLTDVCSQLPLAIVKDDVLIRSRLSKRKISFSSEINISGPEQNFESKVILIDSKDELMNLDVSSDKYTIIKITGKPYSTNE